MLKKIALAVALLCGVALAQQTTTTALDPSQAYSTGNIVVPTTTTSGSTWVNGVYQDQLTCWAWGNPGYCGPNAIVRPGDQINFSFGMTDLYQVRAIADVLPNSGSGLRVNGYTFGFTAKNGNGWDGGRQDYLSAYVLFSSNAGNSEPAFYKTYDLNSTFNWTTFKFDETFDTPFASKDLKTVQYGFVGADTSNYWAGPYGPEVYGVNFSLKYSVDPCASNVLSSPTCPGYLDALAKLAPAPTPVASDPITTTSTSPITTTTVTTDPVAATVTVTSSTTVGQPSVAPVVSAPAATTNATAPSTTQTTKESSGSSSNTSLALSIISKNSDRDAAGAAVAQSAVSQAQSAANQAQQEAASVASNAVANSMSASIVSTNGQPSTGGGLRVTSNNTSGLSVTNNSMPTNNVGTSLQMTNGGPQTITAMTLSDTQTVLSIQQSATAIQQSTSSLGQNTETYSLIPPNMLTDKTNPLNDIIEGKQNIPQNNTTVTTGPVVNKNAQDSDVAGGVSINKMATSPTGYGDYLNFTMRDVAFYAPKEVYKNQRNVDNQRALRTLTNDSKHKEMVEMQYAR